MRTLIFAVYRRPTLCPLLRHFPKLVQDEFMLAMLTTYRIDLGKEVFCPLMKTKKKQF